MIHTIIYLLHLAGSGAQIVILPGTPVAMAKAEDGVSIAYGNQPYVSIWHTGSSIENMPFEAVEPRDICIWNGELVVSDYTSRSIVSENSFIPLPGSPDGICEVFWSSSDYPELAVALFDPGMVVIVRSDGSVLPLVGMERAKCVSAADADGDGDTDIFASGCGSGVILIENREGLPVVHSIGNIQAGVKRCTAADMDNDGLVDVAGIACADGGAGWWRNPGILGGEWAYQEIDGSLEGPKDICISGGNMAIVSLFSSPLFNFPMRTEHPGGFISCCFVDGETLILGHRAGFLAVLSFNPGNTTSPELTLH